MSCVSIGDRFVMYFEKKGDGCVMYFAEIGDRSDMPYTITFKPLLIYTITIDFFTNVI